MAIRKNGGAGNLQRTEGGRWQPQYSSARLTIYQQKLIEYLNFLDPIFRDIQAKDEFGFLYVLLNIRRIDGVKWKTFETLKETDDIFENINKTLGTWKGANTHMSLFRYGLIIESDEIYGFLLNLLRCLNNQPPYMQPFFPTVTKDAKGREKINKLKPKDKIMQIKDLAKRSGIDFYLFDEFYDSKLRNAVFHSTYHFDPYDGTLTLIGDAIVKKDGKAQKVDHPDTIYSSEELGSIVNAAFAFFNALTILRKAFMDIYEGGIEIEGTQEFIPHTFTTVAKEGVGLVGLMETGGPEPLEIPFDNKMMLGRFNADDMESLRHKQYNLKQSPNEKAQARIDALPRRLQKYAGRYYKWKLGY